MRDDPSIVAVATAVPPHTLEQGAARDFARGMFGDRPDLTRLLGVFDNARVRTRQLVQPLAWYRERHSPATRNQVYRRAALDLAQRAASMALARAPVSARDIGGLVFVSTTGVAAPSLDSHLVQLLDLPRDVLRLPLWGLGCAGGGAGLARAAGLVRAYGRPVMVVAVETCSLTFLPSDGRPANVIATSLFGDGAAAAIVAPRRQASHPTILAEVATLLDDTEHVMGWDVVDEGLQVRFAPSIPRLVRHALPGIRDAWAAKAELRPDDLRHFVLHPGGPRVLSAYQEALGLSELDLTNAWDVLRDHGNMSSPTVLFVLERFLRSTRPSGRAGVLLALGPGFCAEGVVFRW